MIWIYRISAILASGLVSTVFLFMGLLSFGEGKLEYTFANLGFLITLSLSLFVGFSVTCIWIIAENDYGKPKRKSPLEVEITRPWRSSK